MNKKIDISEMKCMFTFEEIYNKIKEMYPNMKHLDINYHTYHVIDNDLLKVTNDDAELESVIQEQIEEFYTAVPVKKLNNGGHMDDYFE